MIFLVKKKRARYLVQPAYSMAPNKTIPRITVITISLPTALRKTVLTALYPVTSSPKKPEYRANKSSPKILGQMLSSVDQR